MVDFFIFSSLLLLVTNDGVVSDCFGGNLGVQESDGS